VTEYRCPAENGYPPRFPPGDQNRLTFPNGCRTRSSRQTLRRLQARR
jgi:hypothetical protein